MQSSPKRNRPSTRFFDDPGDLTVLLLSLFLPVFLSVVFLMERLEGSEAALPASPVPASASPTPQLAPGAHPEDAPPEEAETPDLPPLHPAPRAWASAPL